MLCTISYISNIKTNNNVFATILNKYLNEKLFYFVCSNFVYNVQNITWWLQRNKKVKLKDIKKSFYGTRSKIETLY